MSDSIILERYIRDIYEDFLRDIRASKTIDQYMDNILKGASDEDKERFKDWIRAKRIKVIEGYPSHQTPKFPCFTIIAQEGNENSERSNIGDRQEFNTLEVIRTGSDGLAEEADKIECYGNDWISRIDVWSWSENGELTPLLHSLAKHIIFEKKDLLSNHGVFNISLGEGNFHPDFEYFPQIPYVRTLSLNLDGEWVQKFRTCGIKLKHKLTFSVGTVSN